MLENSGVSEVGGSDAAIGGASVVVDVDAAVAAAAGVVDACRVMRTVETVTAIAVRRGRDDLVVERRGPWLRWWKGIRGVDESYRNQQMCNPEEQQTLTFRHCG